MVTISPLFIRLSLESIKLIPSRMALDKNNSDTDGDGRSDGEEIRLEKEYNADMTEVKVTAYMSSDPTKTDSDGDGISDKDDNYPLDPKG